MERDLSLYVVEPTDSLRTAMEKIEQNKHRVVVVVDEGRVLGTVSDGDITLDLFGVFPGDTEIYEDGVRLCAADGATVGRSAPACR